MEYNQSNGIKRPVEEEIPRTLNVQAMENAPVKKIRKSKVQISESNSVINLNENIPGIAYNVLEQSGPPHNTKFTISIQIDDRSFVATGRSKKQAKALAAIDALKYLVEVKKNTCTYVFADGVSKTAFVTNPISEMPAPKSIKKRDKPNSHMTSIISTGKKLPTHLAHEKNPISLINELYKNPQFVLEVEDVLKTGNVVVYKAILKIDGQDFEGKGFSKQTAKLAACKEALAQIYKMSFTPLNMKINSGLELDQNHANKIEFLISNKYGELIEGYPEPYVAKKVLAGIVMTRDKDFENAQVIAVTTGTKVVGGDSLCLEGSVLNDMHAEILARRCLMKFLYSELRKYFNKATHYDTVFDKSINNREEFKVKLKQGIDFHLYISTAPCGDSAVFSPRENSTLQEDVKENRRTHGLLRTKIESGEGTIPVKASIQTWDGILLGNRVLTMSCSDKVCRWNVVGVQGSLLSSVIEPIYFHSLVLGNLLHPVHTFRGICGRVDGIENLPPKFKLNKPYLAMTTSSDRRLVSKSPNYSFNWTVGDSKIEIVNCATGRTLKDQTSDLAKIKFFKRFEYLLKKIPQRYMTHKMILDQALSYGELKLLSKEFQLAKKELYQAFQTKGLGNWLKKPMEQDQFYTNVEANCNIKEPDGSIDTSAIPSPVKTEKNIIATKEVRTQPQYSKSSNVNIKKFYGNSQTAYIHPRQQHPKSYVTYVNTQVYNNLHYSEDSTYYSNNTHYQYPPGYYENPSTSHQSGYVSHSSYNYNPSYAAHSHHNMSTDGSYYKSHF
ncbi:double-stranded RNA-specific editase Adar-like [Condylostylus longicornis]|uniref:double-stranded RNA-specific editase Adar-like n=1 Tax=Condylostylus longicornis TaxID=2530218 RepID=UPI00244DB881|nr:double-stranded RNA-specific editase Adar-like [Condylostylus longicornis]